MAEIYLRLTDIGYQRLMEQVRGSGGRMALELMAESGQFQVGIAPGRYERPDGGLRVEPGTFVTCTLEPDQRGYRLHYPERNPGTGVGGLATLADFATMTAWRREAEEWRELFDLATGRTRLDTDTESEDAGAA